MRLQLDSQEVIQLFNRFHAGDKGAGDEIIQEYMPLVLSYVGKVTRNGTFSDLREDLIQSGMEGLINARDRFELERGNRFSTYAHHWIRKYVNQTIDREVRFYASHELVSQTNSKNEEGEFSESLEERFGCNDGLVDYIMLWDDLEKILTPFELYLCRLVREGKTMEAIGKSRGVSRQRIHQLLKSARTKIQEKII